VGNKEGRSLTQRTQKRYSESQGTNTDKRKKSRFQTLTPSSPEPKSHVEGYRSWMSSNLFLFTYKVAILGGGVQAPEEVGHAALGGVTRAVRTHC
jgi:hypothetical protein